MTPLMDESVINLQEISDESDDDLFSNDDDDDDLAMLLSNDY